jgi:tetratricopeptide (TPR) repeat protein
MKNILIFSLVLLLASCTKTQPTAPDPTDLREQIVDAYQKGQWEKVIQLTDSLVKDSFYADLTLAYVQSLRECGMPTRSINVVRKELENPEDTRTKPEYLYNELALSSTLVGDYDTAIEAYNKALELNPLYVRSLVGLADVYETQGDITKALDYYEDAANLFLTHAFEKEVFAIAYRMTEIAPDDPRGWYILYQANSQCGNEDEATDCLKKYQALAPKN